jgi:AcrR family transcriptional regulator
MQSENADRTDSARTRILDSAERIFVSKGFSGASLRAITSDAGVNLAAAHYYFESKQGLFSAVFQRRIEPINEQRLTNLERLLSATGKPDLRQILTAFLRPVLLHSNQGTLEFMAQLTAEPEELIQPLIAREFGHLVTRFTVALKRVFPETSELDLNIRFSFVVGAMLQTIFNRSSFMGIGEVSKEVMYQRLLDFCVAGFLNNE